MKKIFLLCCLFAATRVCTFAQAPVKVTKSEFTEKSSQLNTLIEQNKTDEAKAAWVEIEKMIQKEFAAFEPEFDQAEKNHDDVNKKNLADIIHTQMGIYTQLSLLTVDLTANKVKINDNLKEFADKLL